jgi:hypothetical protein
MKHLTRPVSLALTTFALLGLAGPGVAQTPAPGTAPPPVPGTPPAATNLVPFTLTQTGGTLDRFVIPLSPPVLSVNINGPGDSPLLGPFTSFVHQMVHLGADGNPLSITDGVGVWQGANGDAVFFTYSGRFLPSPGPGIFPAEEYYVITGGAGRFAGATGSGILSATSKIISPTQSVPAVMFEGVISAPKQAATTPATTTTPPKQ